MNPNRRPHRTAERIRKDERRAVVRFLQSLAEGYPSELFPDGPAKVLRLAASKWASAIRNGAHLR